MDEKLSEDHSFEGDTINEQPSKSPLWKTLTFWNVVFNFILAITTICLGLIAYRQYQSSSLDQRAWVGPTSFIHPGGETKYFKEGSQPSFGVVLTNMGKTPARKMEVMIQRNTFKKGTPFTAVYNDDGKPGSVVFLFPGQIYKVTTNQEPAPLTASLVEMITSGEFTLYLYGMVTYEDVFDVKHQTTFCGFLKQDLTGFNACNTYNQID
ncbi:MAG: hypothetical protein OEV99_01255 [Nitrospira sp.]|nr:hypothetical protein [Nitrospira sp.]MDH4368441.1 hypothetical protein [Nitrospira sp.]MDH5498954.1 hypothetical protein [Nitrospira sp.]